MLVDLVGIFVRHMLASLFPGGHGLAGSLLALPVAVGASAEDIVVLNISQLKKSLNFCFLN